MILGIDEVGRGCWAGPLVAGAALLSADFTVPADAGWRLADSKRLSARQRVKAAQALQALGIIYGLGWVPAAELDAVGLSAAVTLAMRRAVAALSADAAARDGVPIIVDGAINYLADLPLSRAVVKADARFPAVSAASILAKVARDDYMRQLAGQYPQYGFERHVGYGTARHRAALRQYGLTPLHRRSFQPVAAMLH